MKKILLVLISIMISTTIVTAQKQTKALRKAARYAKKEQRIQENQANVFEAFRTNELTFVPTDMSTNTSGKMFINTYNFIKLQPDYISINIPYLAYQRPGQDEWGAGAGATPTKQEQQLLINTTTFEITKKEQTNTGYMMEIKVLANTQYYTITINTNPKNNLTTTSIKSSKNPEVLYTGTLRKN